jgi:hypothetical protein
MSKTLDKRYGVGGRFIAAYNLFDMGHLQRLKEVFFKPYAKMLRDHPYMMEKQPFELV